MSNKFGKCEVSMKKCTTYVEICTKIRGQIHSVYNGASRKDKLAHHAFTLAEVLITLGVIGIVAALTLPTVMQHYKKQEASARLKKFVSTMEQAIRLSELEYGPSIEWDKPNMVWGDDGKTDHAGQNAVINDFYNKYFKKYLKTVKIDKVAPDFDSAMTVYFGDGSTARFYNGGYIDIVFDVNGLKKPNAYCKDQFAFFLSDKNTAKENHKNSPNKAFGTFQDVEINSREALLNLSISKGYYYCTTLLEYDNWEFKDDYPFKL